MFFEKKVGKSKSQMADFLIGHRRYHTMNSWNRLTSYANCIKIGHLGLSREQASRAYEMLDVDFWHEIDWPIDEFTERHGGRYTIGQNGRSGGYLVLYRGEYYDPGYKSHCRACGQLNYQPVNGETGSCGRCGRMERVNLAAPLRWHRTLAPGIDGGPTREELLRLSAEELREKVDLVRDFDATCDVIRDAFIDLLDRCKVVEETVMVPKTVKRIECACA